jgi:uncharacterized protein (DUF427 family)
MAQAATLSNKAPGYDRNPAHRVDLKPAGQRIRVVLGGETLADSRNATLVEETGYGPVYYFPRADVRMEMLERTQHSSYCPYKGTAAYWTLKAASQNALDAVWTYETPYDEALALKGLVSFWLQKIPGAEVVKG